MKVTLLDEQDVVLTEVSSRVGGSAGHIHIDWATRSDVLFQYYFDRGRRSVTAEIGATRVAVLLSTRWQMGARRWFLHEFLPARVPAQTADCAPSAGDSRHGARDAERSRLTRAATDFDALTAMPASQKRGDST